MACSDLEGILHGDFLQGFIIPLTADEAVTRGLTEPDTKFSIGNRTDYDLKKVFDGLNEVALAEDDIAALRNLYALSLQFHDLPPQTSLYRWAVALTRKSPSKLWLRAFPERAGSSKLCK